MLKASNYQLSIFGNFLIKPIPEIIATLMTNINRETQKTFLPNMITNQQINISSNHLSTISNLGFITPDQEYTIAILNNRIDITCNRGNDTEDYLVDFYTFGVKTLSAIIEHTNIVANRLAANIQFICLMNDFDAMYVKGKELVKNAAYYDDKNFVEWSLHANALDSISINGLNEKINVITGISSAPNITGSTPLTAIHIDINTLPENINMRFSKDSLTPFIKGVLPIASRIATDVERLIINK